MKNYNNKTGSEDPSNIDPDSIADALGPPKDLPVNNGDYVKSIVKPEIYSGIPIEKMGILRQGINLEEIEKLSAKNELSNSESYIQTSFYKLERNLEDIKKVFKGKVLVDLGAGTNCLGYKLANLAEAKAYVGVEAHNSRSLERAVLSFSNNFQDGKPIPYSVVDLDMLSFLRCVKNDSINMIAAGIDDYVIHDSSYECPLREEIKRTLDPEGGFLSIHSELYFPDKDKRDTLGDDRNSYIGNIVAMLKK